METSREYGLSISAQTLQVAVGGEERSVDVDDAKRPATHGGTVAWHAAIADYRIRCSVTVRADDVSIVSVDERGTTLEAKEFPAGTAVPELERAALGLREQYVSQIFAQAQRRWRVGSTCCLTTSWGSSPRSSEGTPESGQSSPAPSVDGSAVSQE